MHTADSHNLAKESHCHVVLACISRSFLGGWLGDWAARRDPLRGRVAVAQCSAGVGVPLTLAALKLLPRSGGAWSATAYAGIFGVMGLTMTWCAEWLLCICRRDVFVFADMACVCGVAHVLLNHRCAPACNNPMFSEVVPETHRSLIYAFDRSFEGTWRHHSWWQGTACVLIIKPHA